ncbi:MAG: LysM peptidoglycan-binding domain-containing protein [Bacteroidota bacterium]
MIIFLALFSSYAYAQSIPKMTSIADTLFKNHRYLDATEFYRKISRIDRKNYRAKYRLGFCYLQTLKYEEAKQSFLSLGEVIDTANHFRAKSLYNYSNLLKLETNFKEADSLFSFLISLPDADADLIELSRKQKEGCQLAMRQQDTNKGYSVELLDGVNSKFHDFGGTVNPGNKQLVFASTRTAGGGQYAGSQYDGVLPDLISYEWEKNRWRKASNSQKFSQINSEWSEGSGSFSRDGKTFYFSSCKGSGGSDCTIMVTYLVDGRWSTPEALNEYINEVGSENKQPSLSMTGDTLFFSSNRPGGEGGSDIWMSLRGTEPESWTPAINLGDIINSSQNDITPYYSSAYQCLLFASNGHVGYGGYDIYAAKGESFFEPEIYNLGYPFNSTLDDTYFTISDSAGFLSSNRADNTHLNLYSFGVSNSNERLFLSLLISGESLIDSRINSKFRDIRSLDLFAFRIEDYQGYELFDPVKRNKPKPAIISGDKKEPEEQPVTQQLTEAPLADGAVFHAENNRVIVGSSDYNYDYEHVYFGYASDQLTPVAKKSLEDLVGQLDFATLHSIDLLAYTDDSGASTFNQELSKRRGESIRNYLVTIGVPEGLVRVLARGEGPLSTRDSWYARMFSRRTEIIVNGKTPQTLKRAKPYAIRYESTVAEAASRLGIGVAELKKWNAFKSEVIKPGSIIRVGSQLKEVPSIKFFLEEDDIRNTFFIYSVKKGETLQTIATKYRTPEELLLEVNHVKGALRPGDQIFIYRVN